VAHLEYENIFASQQGIFEVQRGRMVAQVLTPDIKSVRLDHTTAASRPMLETVIGVCLGFVGLYGATSWILGRMAFSDILAILLVAGAIGAAMFYDVLRRRFVLVVSSRTGTHKLAFSSKAERHDVESFCKAIEETYRIPIENKLS
jgi:hypothetical protein